MNEDKIQDTEVSPGFVRDQLDEILAREITALLDVDSNSVMMSFNLASISCITLIVEREREIKQYADFPPERYTRDSFVNELMDIGLERDASLEKALHSVLNKGYISTDSEGQLTAEMPAFMMVGFLDNMFPGMQGMNLVAFILQMNEEVNSKRKSLDLAKDSFKSTLKSRGVSVSKDLAEKKASEIVSGRTASPGKSREVSQKLKRDNVNRLSSLIQQRKKRSLTSSGQLNVKDVFDKGPSKEEIAAQQAEIERAEEAARKAADLTEELAQKDKKIQEAELAAQKAAQRLEEIELREKQLLADREEARKSEETAAELMAREAEMAEREARLKALEERLELEERLKQEENEKQEQEAAERQREIEQEEMKKTSQADDDIESRIAAFESQLAMPCPLCKEGTVESKTTEKGKNFFSCTNPECRFVSWDKPYHFECPLCKNSFLTEMTTPTGEKGLKCPRASCSYTQNNLLDPQQNMAAQASTPSAPKKKRRVVRRKRR